MKNKIHHTDLNHVTITNKLIMMKTVPRRRMQCRDTI